ncbi:MAG: CPBP family intramembrane glutamic endopeptidase [Thermoproteus sp.]
MSRLVDLAIFVSSIAALVVKPPFGYLLALAISSPLLRRLKWLDRRRAYLYLALLAYAIAFAVDLAVGPRRQQVDIITADVLAPVVEEIVFRGIAFKILPTWGAIVISTVAFALLHPYPPLALLYAVALTLAYMGGGLAASTALHAVNNAIWTAIYLAPTR